MTRYIYALICPLIGDVKYVGQTKRKLSKRLQGHFDEYKRHLKLDSFSTHKFNWMKKLDNLNSLRKIKIIELEVCDYDTVDDRERYWIELYNDKNLVNLSPGGSKHSLETIEKIRVGKLGELNPMFGKTLTKDHIDKMHDGMRNSQNFKQSRKSQVFRDKMSEVQSVPIYLLDANFNIIQEFPNCRSCAEFVGYTVGNIKNAVRFKRSIGRWKFKKMWVVRKDNFDNNVENLKNANSL